MDKTTIIYNSSDITGEEFAFRVKKILEIFSFEEVMEIFRFGIVLNKSANVLIANPDLFAKFFSN